MRAVVINMESATERMGVMARQLDLLGLQWDRLEAITPDTLPHPADHPFWQRWQRPLRVTEMALTASHMAAWRMAADAPLLVLEDDALLSPRLPEFWREVRDMAGVDHLSLETRGRRKLIERAPGKAWRMRQDRTGSAAYIVWPGGARALLERAGQVAAPSDALISETAMASYQAVPAMAVQFDICAAYGIDPPVKTRSLIDRAEKPPVPRGAGFRRRRILGQVAMGLNGLTAVKAMRLHVQPAPDLADMADALRTRTG